MKLQFKNIIVVIALLVSFLGSSTFAQERALEGDADKAALKKLFSSMSTYRGVFGSNVIQGTRGRRVTPNDPPGTRLFQSIFRGNNVGRRLARDFDFYAGNFFASNYYELMQEFVYLTPANDEQEDSQSYREERPLRHDILIQQAEAAMPRAEMLLRHWVLEKYYVTQAPDSRLAVSFQKWGAGDSADEQTYATHFFNFFLSSISSELQHLPAFLLLRQVPVGNGSKSPSLQKARDLVWAYPHDRDSFKGRIRNAIHNQLSPTVLDMIDEYAHKYGMPSELRQVRSILVEFFRADPSKVAEIAKSLNQSAIVDAAAALKSHVSVGGLLQLSSDVASLKKVLVTDAIATQDKTQALLLISRTSQYLNGQLNNNKKYKDSDLITKDAVLCMINLFYLEGFLVERNWTYFSSKVAASGSDEDRIKLLAQAAKISTDTIVKAFEPSLEKWQALEPKMHKFIDDTIKSSSLNAASTLIQRLHGDR